MPPDFSCRADLAAPPELMDQPCSREALAACLRDLERVNRWFFAYRPVLAWLDSVSAVSRDGPLRVLDVACGYGDTLRRIERWAATSRVPVELTGLDLNPDTIAIARAATPAASDIRWVACDVFSYCPDQQPHVVLSSLFTHHLEDEAVIRFLRWMEDTAQTGWMVNDLSRAPVPYTLFRWFSISAGLHPFVRHDGPVSIARAFVPADWRRLTTAAGLRESDVAITGHTPARLCVTRIKTP